LPQKHSQIFYHSGDKKSSSQAKDYNKTAQCVLRYLAYRDVPNLIKKYVLGDNALDYGCGTGISTQFLVDQGFRVTGADVSSEMLIQARLNCPSSDFYLVENTSLPSSPKEYDLVFSSFVLFELDSEKAILNYLNEAKRVMKPDAILIAIAGSQEMYSKNWLVFDTNFPSNKNLKSGDQAKIFLREANIEFTDFYWTESDYSRFFKNSQLNLIETIYPLGKKDEPYPWQDELTSSPFVIFVARTT